MPTFAPRGWYLARDVGWLAGVSSSRIGQWTRRGYIRASRCSTSPYVYSFQDVAEAMVVHELIDRGVPFGEIRRAIENLRTQYGDWPLTAAPLATAKREESSAAPQRNRIVLRESEGEREIALDIGRGGGRQAFLPTVHDLEQVRTQLHHGGWVLRTHPEVKHIEVDPDRLSGRPTIRDRRIPAEKVAVLAQSPEGRHLLRTDYKLSTREVEDAVRWYQAVSEHDAA